MYVTKYFQFQSNYCNSNLSTNVICVCVCVAEPYLHNTLIFNIDVDDVVYYGCASNNTVDTNI